MSMPTSISRDDLHPRRVDLRGYRRVEGLRDIEARWVDTKREGPTLLSSLSGERSAPFSLRRDAWVPPSIPNVDLRLINRNCALLLPIPPVYSDVNAANRFNQTQSEALEKNEVLGRSRL